MLPVAFRDPFQRTSQPLRTVAVIPARYESSRLRGKALAEIAGRPMIEHVYHRTVRAVGVDAVVVATDDERIAQAVARFGGVARMTSPEHRTGTDRVAEVAADLACDVIVNVQGDEPMIEPSMIEAVLAPLDADPDLLMSTACRAITQPGDYDSPDVVKVVRDLKGNALYFSRSAVPYLRVEATRGSGQDAQRDERVPAPRHADDDPRVYKHIGLYAFRRRFLLHFAGLPRTPLEVAESLEQLRALEHGVSIRTVETQSDSIGVDTPEDLEHVRRRLAPTAPGGGAAGTVGHVAGEVA